MFKKTKREKELESYINNQSFKKAVISNSQFLQNKRDRSKSPPPGEMDTKNSLITEQKTSLTPKKLIEKIFSIANKQQSLIKCLKLLKLAILKVFNDTKSLYDIILLLYRIDRLAFKVIDMSNDRNTYNDIYQFVYEEIIMKNMNNKLKDKDDNDDNINEQYALDIIEAFKISFIAMGELFTDDSFAFNGSIKKINDNMLSLLDYSSNEKDIDSLLSNTEAIELSFNDSDKELNILSIKRTLLFDCYESMLYSKTQMKTSIIQSFSKLMINKGKLSQKQQKRLNELIKTIKDNNHSNNKISIINTVDAKTKSNPLESYYEVNDAREEKYVISNINKWESKQNGIESTKQYFG